MLTVTTPATDLKLLTQAELRAAVGMTDASQDSALATLGTQAAVAITAACKIARNGIIPPTLRLETVSETIELQRCERYLILARRPIVSVLSGVTEDGGTALTAADYRIHAGSGLLERRSGAYASEWPSGCDIVIPYTAGWSTVPEDLKLAAVKFVQAEWTQGDRDPMLRSVTIEGVSSREYWVDPGKDVVVPAEVMSLLEAGGYVNTWVG